MTITDAVAARRQLDPAACLFKGLADPARLSILKILMTGEKKVVELTTQLELAQSTVSQHLACLRDCALVNVRAEGRASIYSLAHPELMDILTASERLLAATGDNVVLCDRYSVNAIDA